MKKVEYMLNETEARVKVDESLEGGTGGYELEHEHAEVGLQSGLRERTFTSEDDEEYLSVTNRLNTSTEEVHVSDVSSDEEYDHNNGRHANANANVSHIYSSGSEEDESLESIFGSPDDHLSPENKEYETSGSKPQDVPQGTTTTHIPQRSLVEEMNLEMNEKGRTFTEVPTSIPPPRYNDDDGYINDFGYKRGHGPPQDRSVASKKSAHTMSHSVADSFVTPNQPYLGDPIVSPPFSLMSPASSRTGSRSGIRNAKTTTKKTQKSSRTTTGVSSVSRSARKSKSEMKKEIDKLTAEFAFLEQESEKRRARFDLDPEKRFDASVNLMGKKADAMVDSIQRNYARSFGSKTTRNIDNIGSPSHVDTHTPRHGSSQQMVGKTHNKTPQQILNELDPGDEYVKRRYPAVPKTPGTMFTTEMVEVMGLDMGEHAYLAEIMDRQWGTKSDYRPR